jgi:hypothetical protein
MSYTPTFTYNGGANPNPDWLRLMVSDTQQFGPDGVTPIYVFSDQEINSMILICQAQFQSSQFYSPPSGLILPSAPIPWLRVAAGLLDCMVANSAKLSAIASILDVKLAPGKAAEWLKQQAQAYRDADDNSGSFFIVEQVNNVWSLEQRYWKQVQRQQGLGY